MKSELRIAAALGAGLIVSVFGVLVTTELLHAGQWLLQAGVLWGWAWWQLWRRRDLNRAHGQAPLYGDLGLANRLTLLRGGLIALAGGFLWQPALTGLLAWLPGLLYGAAAVLDRVDGFAARKSRRTSLLGCELDTVFDALGLLVAPLLAVAMGKLHWSYLLLSVAFYVFQAALWWRARRHLPIYPMVPSMLRRALAGFQMGLVALALLPVFKAEISQALGLIFMLPVLLGFALDWLVVTGRLKGTVLFAGFQFASEAFLQPALRLLVVLALIGVGRAAGPALTTGIVGYGLVLGACLVMLGVGGRLGALLLLLLLGAHYPDIPLDIAGYSLLVSSAAVLMLGTGRFSPWQGDGAWVNRQDGA